MKSILIGIVILFILSNGIGVVSLSNEEESCATTFLFSFSKPAIDDMSDEIKITIEETNAILKQPNKPLLPIYKKTMIFPYGTNITSLDVSISNIVSLEIQSELMVSAPEVFPPDFTYPNEEYQKTEQSSDLKDIIYPDSWYEYSLDFGMYKGKPSIILHIVCYPVRIFKNTMYYVPNFVFTIYSEDQIENKIASLNDTLLIISPMEFVDVLEPFVEHKQSKGISTKLVSLESIYDSTYFPVQGRDDAEKVKYFIKNAYEEWNIKYVLLVGGRKPGITEKWFMPVRYVHVFWAEENRYISDLYFADIYNVDCSVSTWDTDNNDIFCQWPSIGNIKDDIDLYPEVYVGRWPCRNTFELQIIIQKTIAYESMQLNKKIMLAGGDNFEEPGIEGEIVCDKSLEYLPDFSYDKVYASEMEVSAENIRTVLGNGAIFMHMHGHGNPVKWGTHSPESFEGWMDGLYITDVPWFFNEEYPILILGGCHTGMFNVSLFNRPWIYTWRPTPEGLGWWFARKIDGGGIATIGYTCFPVASPGEYGDLNGDGINEPDCVESGYGFIQLQLLKGYGVEHYQYLGECWGYAISSYLETFKIPYERWHLHTCEGFILLGDPSLKIGGY
jgi:peptidase C25-like protein